MKKLYFLGLCGMIALVAPHASYAYRVVDSEVSHINSTLTIYTLEMEWGFGNAEMWMPIAASSQSQSSADAVGFNTDSGKTTAVILSTTTIDGTKYHVAAGDKGRFTLVVFDTHAAGKAKPTLTVDRLPVWLQRENDKKPFLRTFSGDELKGFVAK